MTARKRPARAGAKGHKPYVTANHWHRAVLLAHLAQSSDWASIRDLGAALGVDQTTLHERASELVEAGYVERRRLHRSVGNPIMLYRAMEIARAAQR